MSEFIAGAFVDVKPDAKGFRTDLQRQIDNQIRTAIKIPVELDPKRFKSTVNTAAKQAQAKVPIVPGTSVAELRTAIKDKIDRATKGLKIRVPIEVEQTGPGSRGGGATAAAGTSARGDRASAANKAATATKKLTDAEKQQLVVDKALQKSQDQLAIASRAFEQATAGGIAAEERIQHLREARTASTRAARAANDVLAVSEGKLTDAQRHALEIAAAEGTATRTAVNEKLKEARAGAAATELQLAANRSRAKAAELAAIEVTSLKTLTDVKSALGKVTATEAALTKQSAAAHELNVVGIHSENAAALEALSTKKALILAQRDELRGETARNRQQKTAARGAGATLLSLLGIRGATLAASSAFLVGAVSAAVFAKSISSFAKFETELNVFQATAGATAEQMKQVAAQAQILGRDITLPGVTAADAANAMSELSRAGLSVRDSIAGARGVLQLAAAAQISNADAATLAASALNAFGLEGEDAGHVADLLANAANAAQGSIAEMGAALQQASAIARQVGLSLDDTVATLTIFARNGLRGSDAGTSLRTALSRLIAPTKKASDLIAGLGLNLRDAQGNIRADVFAQFGQATENLTPALRDMIAETIAGQDAIRAFSIGAREGARGLKLAQLQMQAQGSAANLAAARSKGLAGQFSALTSNAQTLGTTLGKLAAGPVAETVKGLNNIFTALNQLATGDFGGFASGIEHDFRQAAANIERRAKGFNKLGGGDFSGLKDILGNAPDVDQETKRLQVLQETLTRLQNLRVASFQVGGDIGPITKQIKDLQRQLRAAKVDAGLLIPVTKLEKQLAPLREARKEAADLRQEILDTGGSPSRVKFLDDLITQFDTRIKLATRVARNAAKNLKKQVEDDIAGIDVAKQFEANFKQIAGNIALATPEVLGSLNDLARQIKNSSAVTGEAGTEIGKRLIASIQQSINAAVENDDPETAAALKKLADKIAALFGVSLAAAFKNIKVPLTEQELTDALLPQRIASARAEAFGSVGDQIKTKESELAALKDQLNDVVKGSAQEETILNAIASKKSEIRALRESQAQDQKEADQKSDKKVTDAISGKEQALRNKLTIAQNTASLKDDIAAQVALRNFYTAQIAVVKATVRDAETRRDQVDELEQKRFEVDNDLTESRRSRREQLRDKALKPIDDAAARADETETLKDDVKQASRRVVFWKNQVKVLKRLVKERKATAEEVQAAQDELDTAESDFAAKRRARRDQKRDIREQSLQLDISFAQTTENKSAEIAARRRFIAFLESQKKFVRGNILKLKELRNEIAEQKKAIKDINDEAKDADNNATTAFELLQQAAETFRSNAGTLIGGDQPFAGPAGFTADLAQFLRRQARTAAGNALTGNSPSVIQDDTSGHGLVRGAPTRSTASSPFSTDVPQAVDRNRASLDRLTTSVDRLTNTLDRLPGTGKSDTKKARTSNAIDRNDRTHFATATAARRVVENRTGI